MQWHPEKNSFEWLATEATSHTGHAVEITQATANFFVNEARKSNHRFLDQDEEGKALIYNYCPVYTDDSFEQKYYFWNNFEEQVWILKFSNPCIIQSCKYSTCCNCL